MSERDTEIVKVGSEVYWSDPDDDICSGRYRVVAVNTDLVDEFDGDTVVSLVNDEGSALDAFLSELS